MQGWHDSIYNLKYYLLISSKADHVENLSKLIMNVKDYTLNIDSLFTRYENTLKKIIIRHRML